jgi:mannose-6-phosphate isomerase-like protein (cupin superfamily)
MTGITIGKVWGKTSPILRTPLVEVHKVLANPGGYCSKHKHAHKWNAFYVISGTLLIKVWAKGYDLVDVTTLDAGDFTTVEPGLYHDFEVSKNGKQCEFLEIYYLEPLAEDIIRESIGGVGGNGNPSS